MLLHIGLRFLEKMAEVAGFFLIGFVLETFWPVTEDQKVKSRAFNALYTLFFEAFEVTGTAYVVYLVTASVRRAPFHDLISLGNDHGRIAISVCLVMLSVFVGDFFYYWMHRLQHSNPWLWAMHEVHHSEETMNVTTAWRHHWLEKPLQAIFMTAPLTLLFKPPVITVFAAFALGQSIPYFIHLNARIDLGPLKKLVMNPHSHRIHHSKLAEHLDKNFASSFSLWDVIFGTYYDARDDEWPETGLVSGRSVTSMSDALLLPFKTWASMLGKKST